MQDKALLCALFNLYNSFIDNGTSLIEKLKMSNPLSAVFKGVLIIPGAISFSLKESGEARFRIPP